jgi:DNA-binding transcriptional regulator LsrR (DeoR family)
VRGVRAFLETLPQFRTIFGPLENGHTPLIRQLDTMLSGVGAPGATGPSGSEFERAWYELTEQLLEDEKARFWGAVIGNLCGRWIAKKDASPEDMRLVDEVNQRVFVPEFDDFRRCAERSRDKGTPGPIIIAAGAHKAAVVAHVCVAGLVREIIIDETLAREMGRLLDVDLSEGL